MKIAAFDQQIPELKENLQANLAAIKTMEAEERELRC